MWAEVILGVVLVAALLRFFKKPANYPPGPWGLPLIGSLPIGGKPFDDRLTDLKNKHGDIIMWRLGSRLMLFLLNYKLVKEYLNSPNFADRPTLDLSSIFADKNTGLASNNGIRWHFNRRFSLRLLRDLGMGKRRIESSIHHEAKMLVESFKKTSGKPQIIPSSLALSVLNVIWQMIASKRYEENDEDFEKQRRLTNDLIKSGSLLAVPDFFPWIKCIFPNFVIRWMFNEQILTKLKEKYEEMNMKIIKEHEIALDENDPKDFVDFYLLEMKKPTTEENAHMSYADLISCMAELHHAGHETTFSTLVWAIYYLATFSEVQKRMQEEVDEILPGDSYASYDDKPRLNYSEAVIHEVHRYSSFASVGVMRCSDSDMTIEGYFIPKGTIMNPGIFWCHNDPKHWDSPEKFQPERFLDENNKFVYPKKGFLPFGSGKRHCIGEALSRMELLIILTALVKHFDFSPPPGEVIDLAHIPTNLFGHAPKSDEVKVLIRIRDAI